MISLKEKGVLILDELKERKGEKTSTVKEGEFIRVERGIETGEVYSVLLSCEYASRDELKKELEAVGLDHVSILLDQIDDWK